MMRKPIEHQIVRQSWSELRRGGSTAKSQLKLTLTGSGTKTSPAAAPPIVLLDNCFRRRSPSTQLRLTCASALSGNLFHFTSITSTYTCLVESFCLKGKMVEDMLCFIRLKE
ncbi:hypothetical protein HPP92_001596 [Vanilla planifolia]|uniref:Uncharacterized protein n=1 Tax=Vanilla planifolia TaxID=51239 RepID=A0A835RYB1_VANPL|nr:hypothetical protein HPP92_001596 [Vanilla planifolia]